MTNYEKIKNMTVEELAERLGDLPSCILPDYYHCSEYGYCKGCYIHWLNEEAEE